MRKLLIAAAAAFLLFAVAAAAHIVTPVSNLDDLANAITANGTTTQRFDRVRVYAQAQAAATQSQEAAIEELQGHVDALGARVAALEGTPPPPPPPAPACSDTVDNDADGLIDYPSDPGCSSATDTDETDAPPPPPPPPPPTGFPDASNTGVPDGTVLTAYTGPNPVVADNTVIDGKEAGCLTIKATNVVIKNSYLHGNGCAVLVPEDPAVCVASSGGPCTVTIQDSTLSCNNGGGTAVYYRDYTVIRSDISGCENGFDASANATVKDSYIHDLWQGSGAHTDGMQLSGGHVDHAFNVTLDHNTITGLDNNGRTINAALISNGGPGDTNIVVKNNLLGGGGYTVYCPGWQNTGNIGSGDQIVDNHWRNNYAFGHSVGCDDPLLTVADNVDYPDGNPINLG